MSTHILSTCGSNLPMATLKDATAVPEPVVKVIMLALSQAQQEGYFVLYDLFEKCKDPQHPFVPASFGGNSEQILKKYTLIGKDNNVHDLVKHIALNAIAGDGFSKHLINPRQNTDRF